MHNLYKRHRFPPSVIQHVVWLYYRFNLSIRDVEDLLAKRNINVSYEAIRLWINKFGPEFARRLKRRHQGFGDTYFLDEVFVKIGGKQHYLWRAVDQDGEVVDVYLQERRDANAAKRFFQRFFKTGGIPREIVTDKLRSYGVAHRTSLSGFPCFTGYLQGNSLKNPSSGCHHTFIIFFTYICPTSLFYLIGNHRFESENIGHLV